MDISFNIFISHDHKDEAVAMSLKVFLESVFLNSNVYVSGVDLEGGQTWIENIKTYLKTSSVIITLITRESIKNNWIYFETGSGFVEDKSIPLLGDNLKFSDLKPPLSLLQARTLTLAGINSLVNDISNKLKIRKPKQLPGLQDMLDEVDKFFSLRGSEMNEQYIAVAAPLRQLPNNYASDKDPELIELRNKVIAKAKKAMISKILTYKDQFDLPTEEELVELDLGKLQDLSITYNIPTPSTALYEIFSSYVIPPTSAMEWEKLNIRKKMLVANLELDKFSKSI